ncbi:MAG: hypothetical protein SGBAC_011523 [Bacillariaceae sp.]
MTDSSLSSYTYTCMGTRMVVITSKDGDSSSHPREGLLVVFQKTNKDENISEDQEPYPMVQIRLGTDQGIYACDIPHSKVSLSKEEKKKLPEILMQDQPSSSQTIGPIQLSFQFSSEGELKIFLKQKLTSGMSKNAFRSILCKQSSVSLLKFCADLGEAINGGMSNVKQLQEDLTLAKSNAQQWKETANKLETGATQAKNLILKGAYNAWIQNQAKQKKLVEDLKKQLSKGGKSSSNAIPETLAPDDVEQAIETDEMPSSMIKALAEGRGVYNDNERKPILDKGTMNTTWKKDKQDYKDERRGKAKRKASSSSDEEIEEEAPKTSRVQKKRVTKRRRKSSESSESQMSEDSEEKPKATSRTSRRKKVRMDIDSDDNDDSDSNKTPAAMPAKKSSNRTNSESSETDNDDIDTKRPIAKPTKKRSKPTNDNDSSETDDGDSAADSKPPAQAKNKATFTTTAKVDSDDDDDDSDSEDSLLAHMGVAASSPTKKIKKEASDSDTDNGDTFSTKPAPAAKQQESDSDDDSDTDDGGGGGQQEDKNSNSALVKSLLKTAKKVKEDDWDDF